MATFNEVATAETLPAETNYVPGEGPLDCKICFVGEAPGATERKEGRPFVGMSGRKLEELMRRVGIGRTECYITNVIKEQPPGNDITKFIDVKKGFVSDKATEYQLQLIEELEQCKANVIVAVGGTALSVLTRNSGILKWRGSILESSLVAGRKVVPIIHPRAVLGPSGVYLWEHWILADLRRVVKESLFPELRLPSMVLHTRPSYYDVVDYLGRCAELPVVDVDIEVLREEVSCISFAMSSGEAMSIPFVAEHGDYWTPDNEMEIWRMIASILESPTILKRGQNFLFDMSFLLARHGIRTVNVVDTMVAQAILYPDFPKGLDFITTSYTTIPYYKEEGKKWKRITGDWRQHWEYNCKDTIATASAYPVMMQELEQQGNTDTFWRQNALLEPLSAMQMRGIRMDVEGMKLAHESVTKEIEHLTSEFYKIAGREINLSSPKQLMEYFYDEKKLPVYSNRKTHKPTIDEDALKRISRKGYKEASILIDIRGLNKLRGTYLEVQLDTDSRLRCAFNPVGAATGRLSSGKTILGTGTNLQNQPPEMKRFMLFDEGYVGYNIDLSQAENRIVAYVGPVPEMIECFESGKDVHSLTASMEFGIPVDEIKQMDDEGIKAPLCGGAYTHRFWGKKSNHSFNYGFGYRNFALMMEMPESEGKFIHTKYHRAYPGVEHGFQEQVRQMINTSRTVTNLMGRKRLFLDRYGDTLFKEAYAQIPQSSVADIINERGLGYIYYNDAPAIQATELLLQVHDSIVFQLPVSLNWEQHAQVLLHIKNSLETPLHWRGREFIIPMDLEMSTGNMGKYKKGGNDAGLRKVGRDAMANNATLAETLEKTYGEMTNARIR